MITPLIRKIVAILGPDQTAVQNCRVRSQEGNFSQKERRTKERQKTIPAEVSYNDKCFLLHALKQSVLVPCVHACIFSWHNWAIRVTLMHHIYLLFITGRICPDWPRILLWQLFSQLLFRSILEFRVFSLCLFHLNKRQRRKRFSFNDFQTLQALGRASPGRLLANKKRKWLRSRRLKSQIIKPRLVCILTLWEYKQKDFLIQAKRKTYCKVAADVCSVAEIYIKKHI